MPIQFQLLSFIAQFRGIGSVGRRPDAENNRKVQHTIDAMPNQCCYKSRNVKFRSRELENNDKYFFHGRGGRGEANLRESKKRGQVSPVRLQRDGKYFDSAAFLQRPRGDFSICNLRAEVVLEYIAGDNHRGPPHIRFCASLWTERGNTKNKRKRRPWAQLR